MSNVSRTTWSVFRPAVLVGLIVLGTACGPGAAPSSSAADSSAVAQATFEAGAKTILQENCGKCHGGDAPKGGFSVESAATIHKGGTSGAVIIPGDSGSSVLIRRVEHAEGVKPMPPKGEPLTSDQIAALRSWIDQGAQ